MEEVGFKRTSSASPQAERGENGEDQQQEHGEQFEQLLATTVMVYR